MIDALTWNGTKGFSSLAVKKDWYLNGTLAGTFSADRKLSHYILHNASHMAPYESGEAALDMFNHILASPKFAGRMVAVFLEKPSLTSKAGNNPRKDPHP